MKKTTLYIIVIIYAALYGIPLFIWSISNDIRELMHSIDPYDPTMPFAIIMGVWSLVLIAFTAFYTSRLE